jgi:hypothetical protein
VGVLERLYQMNVVETAVTDFLAYAPKLAAFAAGSAVEIPVAAGSYTIPVPDLGDVKVSFSAFNITLQK